MNEAAAQPPPVPAWDGALMAQVMSRLGAVHEAVLRDIEVQGDKAELMVALGRLADLQVVMTRGLMAQTMGEMDAPPPEPAPARHRHRASRRRPERPPHLRPVKGLVPAGGLVTALRHVLAAHPGPAVATGAAGLALAATGIAVPAHLAVHHVPLAAASAPAAAGIDVSAVPAPPPSAAVPSADARSAHKAYKARHGRPVVPAVSPPPLPAVPPPSPFPSPPPSSPPSSPVGVLSADRPVVAMGAARTATVTLTASGGPVTWTCQPVAGLILPALGGLILPGVPAEFTVNVADPSQGGQAVVVLEPGDLAVTVTWDAAPAPSPSPSPS